MKNIFKCMLLVVLLLTSCEKFLDVKPDQRLTVPRTIRDLQSLLEDQFLNSRDPFASEASADNYFVLTSDYTGLESSRPFFARLYTWNAANIFQSDASASDWLDTYGMIAKANIVLEEIENIEKNSSNQTDWNTTKGNALFLRSFQYLNAVSIWSLAYDESTASSDLGIPLRTTTDFNIKSERASVKDSYERICSDLKEAADLLPSTSVHPVRPSKASAFALLSRTYLYMGKYNEALNYATQCLALRNQLMDYNNDPEILGARTFPFNIFNKEVLYHSLPNSTYLPLIISSGKIDQALYASYSGNDLRKSLFYKSAGVDVYKFYGNYSGGVFPFSGLAIDEVYLTRAECNARLGNLANAMKDLNDLCSKRYDISSFVPFSAANSNVALQLILSERRKELPFRNVRWMDIKRLNKTGANIILKRDVNSQVFTLEPNSLRYALPIPENIINVSGMPQNLR